MALITRYVDPDATGAGDGTSWADAYTSLSSCEANENKDFVTATDWLEVYCRSSSGSADTSQTLWDGGVTSATYDVKIFQDATQAHSGVWSSSYYRIISAKPIQFNDDFGTIEGLQLSAGGSDTFTDQAIRFNNGGSTAGIIKATNILAKHTSGETDTCNALSFSANSSTTIIIRNSIFYDFPDAQVENQAAPISYILNCTFVGDGTGSTGIAPGFSSKCRLINTVLQGMTSQAATGFHADSDYNICNLSTVPGSNSIASTTLTFADAAGDDYHLASGDVNNGQDLSSYDYTVTDDIDGDSRTSWHIGADEYVTAGGDVSRTLTDYLDISDSVLSYKSRNRALLDSLNMYDSIIRSAYRYSLLADQVDLTDETLRYQFNSRTLTDVITVQDYLDSYRYLYRMLQDDVNVTDSIDSSVLQPSGTVITRILTDNIDVTDLRVRVLSRLLEDPISIVDSILSQSAGVTYRTLTDNISVSDSAERFISMSRMLLDEIELIDTIVRAYGANRVLEDQIDLADSLIKIFQLRRILQSNIDMEDEISSSIIPFLTYVIELIKTTIEEDLNIVTSISDDFDIDAGF